MSIKRSTNGVNFTPTIHSDTYPFITPTQFTFTGTAVLITGASKGCGRSTALSYARAGCSQIALGARSSMSDLEPELLKAAQKAGKASPQILLLELDVASEASVTAAAAKVKAEFGRLDILINNAGYASPMVSIMEEDAGDWWRTWEVNVKGPFLLTRAFLPLLLSSAEGLKTIINVSSIGAHTRGSGSGYTLSKLALLGFGETIANEHGEAGIVCFGIHPGAVPTELAGNLPKAYRHMLIDSPELAGDSLVWLSEGRKAWLNGRYVSCTWDMGELVAMRGEIEEGDLLKVRMDVGERKI